MARTAEFYINRATAAFECGFTSKAAQKRVFDDLNRAFEMLSDELKKKLLTFSSRELSDDDQEKFRQAYYDLPHNLHQWKPKHSETMIKLLPLMKDVVTQIESLVDFRTAVKSAPIVKVERSNEKEVVERVTKSVMEIMERRKEQYNRALDLYDLFNGLPVHANVHYVVNQHGTVFLRCFYYLNDTLTPLSVIIAAAQTKAKESNI